MGVVTLCTAASIPVPLHANRLLLWIRGRLIMPLERDFATFAVDPFTGFAQVWIPGSVGTSGP